MLTREVVDSRLLRTELIPVLILLSLYYYNIRYCYKYLVYGKIGFKIILYFINNLTY